MICPACKKMVEPDAGTAWLKFVDLARGLPEQEVNASRVLQAVMAWDQATMWRTGRSVLPTELRGEILNALTQEQRKEVDDLVQPKGRCS